MTKKPMFTDCFIRAIKRAYASAADSNGRATLPAIASAMPKKYHRLVGSHLKSFISVAFKSGISGLAMRKGRSGGVFSTSKLNRRKRVAKVIQQNNLTTADLVLISDIMKSSKPVKTQLQLN